MTKGKTLKEFLEDYKSLRELFELQHKAFRRANEYWQLKTGNNLTWPDQAELIKWLQEQVNLNQTFTEQLKKAFDAGEKSGYNRRHYDDFTSGELEEIDYDKECPSFKDYLNTIKLK